MAWTDEMVEDLRKMWKEGLTTGEIGKRLSVSKNSIVGKVHRLGLSGRPSPIKKKEENCDASQAPKTEKAKAPKIEKPIKPAKPAPHSPISEKASFTPRVCDREEISRNIGFASLSDLDNHTCRWPIGDPKDENFHFCGKKVKIGQTYCDEHSAIAYVKAGKKQ